jgi:DNA-binding transcriptional LysR family regulator
VLDTRRLAILREVARSGSLAGAARTLQYTQPAVAHHVRRLEGEIGTKLLVRDGRRVRLTEAGLALCAGAERILNDLAAVEEEVAAIAGLRSGSVRVVSFPSATANLLPAAIAHLSARHPDIAVSVVDVEPPESLQILRVGDCDLAIDFEYPRIERDDDGSFLRRLLREDPMYVALPADHPLADFDEIDLASLADERWIAGCPRCRGHLLHLCHESGFQPAIAFSTDDYVSMQAMVAGGLGVGLVSELALQVVSLPGVAVRSVLGRPMRTISAITTGGMANVPAVNAMLSALEAAGVGGSAERMVDVPEGVP